MNTATISAKYLPLLGEFRANKDDVRYYLQAISIEPHEESGAYIVSTDGHRIVVIHDEFAMADNNFLVNPSKIIIRESKSAKTAHFIDDRCELIDEDGKFNVSAPAPIVDAKYIDWRALLPADDVKAEPASIDPGIMAAISKAPFGDGEKSAFIYMRQDKPCIIRFPLLPEILILIMPMNCQKVAFRPEWAKKRKGKTEEQMGFELINNSAEEE